MEISSIHRSYLGWPIDWSTWICSPNELRHRNVGTALMFVTIAVD